MSLARLPSGRPEPTIAPSLSDPFAQDDGDRRRHDRYADVHKARVTLTSMASCDARIDNLSSHGCKLVGPLGEIRCGQFIVMRLHGIGRVNGLVRWTSGDAAGVEFTRALDDSVVGRLDAAGSAVSIATL